MRPQPSGDALADPHFIGAGCNGNFGLADSRCEFWQGHGWQVGEHLDNIGTDLGDVGALLLA